MDATLPLFDDYKVNLDAFEGPLDLLLHLIRKEEVDIYDIPIGRITEQYLTWLDTMRSLDINVAGEFVVMAATLMLIKSRMLLPAELKSSDLPEEELDPRLDLVRQLVEYKKYKDAAQTFSLRELLRGDTFAKGTPPEAMSVEDTTAQKLGDLGTLELLEAFHRVLERAQETVSFGHLKMMRWRVPDKIKSLLEALIETPHRKFDTLFPEDAPKGEIIVTFIALLELLRLRHVSITQNDTFGDIYIDALPKDTPDAYLPLPAFDEIDTY
ncbi:MAG: segregation/condensation protein A [Kiritimatiellia bacterium]